MPAALYNTPARLGTHPILFVGTFDTGLLAWAAHAAHIALLDRAN